MSAEGSTVSIAEHLTTTLTIHGHHAATARLVHLILNLAVTQCFNNHLQTENSQNHLPFEVFQAIPSGRRPGGRPRTPWRTWSQDPPGGNVMCGWTNPMLGQADHCTDNCFRNPVLGSKKDFSKIELGNQITNRTGTNSCTCCLLGHVSRSTADNQGQLRIFHTSLPQTQPATCRGGWLVGDELCPQQPEQEKLFEYEPILTSTRQSFHMMEDQRSTFPLKTSTPAPPTNQVTHQHKIVIVHTWQRG